MTYTPLAYIISFFLNIAVFALCINLTPLQCNIVIILTSCHVISVSSSVTSEIEHILMINYDRGLDCLKLKSE